MPESQLEIRLSFVPGLREIVLGEISSKLVLKVISESKDSIYIEYVDDFSLLQSLRSVSRVYLVVRTTKYNPSYISNHKSVLGNLIEEVLGKNEVRVFKTFKIACAGADSKEVKEINEYVESNFGLLRQEEADLKIHIVKVEEIWEVGLQITPRPLSFRDYKLINMSGAMDPTIAFALNSLSSLEQAKSYLNVFSGSATLLIEAGKSYSNLEKLVGFDINKEYLSLSIQNIKKAGLIEKVQVKEGDIFNHPDFGKFDVIVSDLPFGMVISKSEDLENLYKIFIEYSKEHLNIDGVLAVYTSQYSLFEKLVTSSHFVIIKTLEIQLITSEEQYLPTKIIILKLK